MLTAAKTGSIWESRMKEGSSSSMPILCRELGNFHMPFQSVEVGLVLWCCRFFGTPWRCAKMAMGWKTTALPPIYSFLASFLWWQLMMLRTTTPSGWPFNLASWVWDVSGLLEEHYILFDWLWTLYPLLIGSVTTDYGSLRFQIKSGMLGKVGPVVIVSACQPHCFLFQSRCF